MGATAAGTGSTQQLCWGWCRKVCCTGKQTRLAVVRGPAGVLKWSMTAQASWAPSACWLGYLHLIWFVCCPLIVHAMGAAARLAQHMQHTPVVSGLQGSVSHRQPDTLGSRARPSRCAKVGLCAIPAHAANFSTPAGSWLTSRQRAVAKQCSWQFLCVPGSQHTSSVLPSLGEASSAAGILTGPATVRAVLGPVGRLLSRRPCPASGRWHGKVLESCSTQVSSMKYRCDNNNNMCMESLSSWAACVLHPPGEVSSPASILQDVPRVCNTQGTCTTPAGQLPSHSLGLLAWCGPQMSAHCSQSTGDQWDMNCVLEVEAL